MKTFFLSYIIISSFLSTIVSLKIILNSDLNLYVQTHLIATVIAIFIALVHQIFKKQE
jgi:hypothetical protein